MLQPGTNKFSMNGNNWPSQDSDMVLSFKTRRSVANVASTIDATTDQIIAYTTLTATRAVTLPDPTTCKDQHFMVIDESGNGAAGVKLTAVGTINGSVNPDLVVTAYGFKRFYSNGVAFFFE